MTVQAIDNFIRANNANLGANWTITPSGVLFQIFANNATTAAAASRYGEYYNAVTLPNDQYALCIVGSSIDPVTDNGVGPTVRESTSTDTRYLVQGNANESKIYKAVSGTFTQLGINGPAVVNGDILKIIAQGTTITAQRNGVNICNSPLTDASIASGRAGIWGSSSGPAITASYWEAGDLLSGIPMMSQCMY